MWLYCFYIGITSGDSSRISQLIKDIVSNCGNISTSLSSSTESFDAILRCTITSCGHRHYVPICMDDSSKPFVNQNFESLEKGLNFYKKYGQVCGFDTRRTTNKKADDDKTIITKYVICSRAGFKERKKKLNVVIVKLFGGGHFLTGVVVMRWSF